MSLDSRYADRKRPLIIDNPWIILTEKNLVFYTYAVNLHQVIFIDFNSST